MKLNLKGLVEAQSVQDVRRVILRRHERDSIRLKLTKARFQGQVEIGEIAVIDDREFLRLDGIKSNGVFWLEIE